MGYIKNWGVALGGANGERCYEGLCGGNTPLARMRAVLMVVKRRLQQLSQVVENRFGNKELKYYSLKRFGPWLWPDSF